MKIGMDQQCFELPMFKISAFYIEIKGAKNTHVLQVLVGVLDDSEGSWLAFKLLIMMGMDKQCPKLNMFWISALYIEFEVAKIHHVL